MRRSWNKKNLAVWSVLGGAFTILACSSADDTQKESAVGQTGLFLKSDVVGGTDVGGIRYEIVPVDCETGAPSGEAILETRDLEDSVIPGGIGTLEDAPLDADSEHLFADYFKALPAGCYDVTTTPVTADGAVSEDCNDARKGRVEVLEGQTTEIFLINQCEGVDPGALDAISTLNHEPDLRVDFSESKFGVCSEPRVVCATSSDPDSDPLEFVWELSASSPAAAGPTIVSRETDPETGAVTECAEFIPTIEGKYDLEVRVYDLLVDSAGGTMRVEDFHTAKGDPHESHAELDLFFYAGGCDGEGSGGSASGGAASGGAASGGESSGGAASGGAASGGESSGGAASGGAASGGAASGGESSGGAASGGASSGGSGSGGETGSGGSGTGGSGGTTSAYDIELDYLTPVSPDLEALFADSAARWEEVIVGDIPDIDFSAFPVPPGSCGDGLAPAINTNIDDLAIFVQVEPIDGVNGILGMASPCLIRGGSNHSVTGIMIFDSADMPGLIAAGTLGSTILHEMGHVIGIGTNWARHGLLQNPSIGTPAGSRDTYFSGSLARSAFDAVGGSFYGGQKVPVENFYGFGDGAGTRDAHWRESTFDTELMTGIAELSGATPLSLVTVQSLADMGYEVDPSAADAYSLPAGGFLRSEKDSHEEPLDDVLDVRKLVVDAQGRIVSN